MLAEPEAVGSVLLIALKSDGSGKAAVEHPKKIIGSPKGLPLVVSPINDGLGLAVTEGLEDALSVAEATGLGVWASGGATFLAKIADSIPHYVEAVTIYAHADAAGQAGAEALARDCEVRGRSVSITGDVGR